MLFGPIGARQREDLDEFTETRDRMDRVSEVLRDPGRTAFRVVTIPETMAVHEESLATLEDALPELAMWPVPDRSGEVTGLAALEPVATNLPVGAD